MDDVPFVLGAIAFFALALAYIAACARLQRPS
jgi:hypothetical protein